MLAMASNGKCFAPNMHAIQSDVYHLNVLARRLADVAEEAAPFDE